MVADIKPKYVKKLLNHKQFYIVSYTQNIDAPYFVFLHGGPGFNCGILEYLIDNQGYFADFNYNFILYDQRNCGRSTGFPKVAIHDDNINDVNEIYLNLSQQLDIAGFIGHSYGATLLYHYCVRFRITLPAVFVATSDSTLMPRLNNLMIDLAYLKKSDPAKYIALWNDLDKIDASSLWQISEKLNDIFQINPNRLPLYWANLDCCNLVQSVQKEINLPIDNETFLSVRQSLYADEELFLIEITRLKSPYLWINGFHDFIMNGAMLSFGTNPNMVTFYKSAHYPHLEENALFCRHLNEFIRSVV